MAQPPNSVSKISVTINSGGKISDLVYPHSEAASMAISELVRCINTGDPDEIGTEYLISIKVVPIEDPAT